MFTHNDTIVAIATAPGRGGIGVTRLSGPRAIEIAARLARRDPRSLAPNRATHHNLYAVAADNQIDDVVTTCFQAPNSYTGEDVIEISSHGNPLILEQIVKEAIALGARPAGPGEFTMRAFLNGKMDLSQAEALGDLIGAQTYYQVKLARAQLGGSLAQRVTPLKEELLNLIVNLETAVEFIEDDVTTEQLAVIDQRMKALIDQFDLLAGSFSFGRIVREGLKIGVVGRPNVGKSSVFNHLLESERAIVTDIPGTTRDVLTESVEIAGIPVTLIDTAGIRQADNLVESLGIERSRQVISDADLVLAILDSSTALTDDDYEILNLCAELKHIVLMNKQDLPAVWSAAEIPSLSGITPSAVSAKTGTGFADLKMCLEQRLKSDFHYDGNDPIITNHRHHRLICQARADLLEARETLRLGMSEEVVLVGLHSALRQLGEITGETIIEDILTQIFGKFCIGK